MRQAVAFNSSQVIDKGHKLSVEAVGGAENGLVEVHCGEDDRGLIIGKNGRNIEAIRTLARLACRGAKLRTSVEVVNSRR